jgi:Na+/H+-dicarboxylate symporter
MKLWFKFAAGLIFGTALFLVVPSSYLADGGVIATLAEISLRLGYYAVISLLCVNLPLGIMKVSESGILWKMLRRILRFDVLSLFVASAIGIAAALLALPVRIPLMADISAPTAMRPLDAILSIFPKALGPALAGAGEFVFPALALAFALGLAMAHDSVAARPLANLLDSASRVLYTLNTFITELVGLFLIPIGARALHSISSALADGAFGTFALLLGGVTLFAALVLIPAIAFFLGGKRNPYPLVFANLPGMLASAASGNLRFSAGTAIRQVSENLGVKRRYNSIALPGVLLFGRAGTALVTSLALVVILSSYSPVVISGLNLLFILLLVPLSTILAGSSIQNGPMVAITFACTFFGRGFENGFLVMAPFAFVLASAATFLDIAWIGCAHVLASPRQIPAEIKSPQHFI